MSTLVLALVLAGAEAVSTGPAVEVTARLGVNGFSDRVGWNYVVVELTNRGDEARCELRMPVFGETIAVYARRVVLPKHSRKRVFLYFRPGEPYFDGSLEVFVGDKDQPFHEVPFSVRQPELTEKDRLLLRKEARQEPTLPYRRPTTTLPFVIRLMHSRRAVAVIGEKVGLGSHLLSLERDIWRACMMLPADLPDRWIGFTLFDAVILSRCDPTKMSAAQQQALIDWVKAGGKLIVAGGLASAQLRGSLLGVLCPSGPGSTERSDHGAVAAWCNASPHVFDKLLCAGFAQDEGEALLVTNDGRCLVHRRRFGLGRIDRLSFDPSLDPFRSWTERGKFWAQLVGVDFGVISHDRNARYGLDLLGGPLTTGVGRSALAYGAIAAFIVIYAIAIGPALYVLLRRSRRYSLYATAILATITVFSFLAYGLCSWVSEAKHVANVITFIDVPASWDSLFGHSFVASHRSSSRPLRLEVEPIRAAVSPMPNDRFLQGVWSPPREDTKVEILSQADKLSVTLPKPLSRLNSWEARWSTPFPSGVAGVAGLRRVLQLLGGRLKRCHVLTGDGMYYVGEVDGEHLALPFEEYVGTTLHRLERQVVCGVRVPRGVLRNTRDRLRLLQTSFASGVYEYRRRRYMRWTVSVENSPLSLREGLDRGQAYLFGWARTSPFTVRFTDSSPGLRSLVLVRIALPPDSFASPVEKRDDKD